MLSQFNMFGVLAVELPEVTGLGQQIRDHGSLKVLNHWLNQRNTTIKHTETAFITTTT